MEPVPERRLSSRTSVLFRGGVLAKPGIAAVSRRIRRRSSIARRKSGSSLRHIEAFSGPRSRPPVDGGSVLRLSEAVPLLPEIAASSRALVLRQALLALGFDERRLTPWRLEHKLLQAHVFRHFVPDSIPPTSDSTVSQGLDDAISAPRSAAIPAGLRDKDRAGRLFGHEIRFPYRGRALLDGARRTSSPAGMLRDRRGVHRPTAAADPREYRVHSVEDQVIENLTVYRHEGPVGPGEREAPNRYVQETLDALPAGITAGSHLGWDVAELEDGFAAGGIEVNIGGIHPIYNPGFHCSGFFHHRDYGAIYSARLLRFLEMSYTCRIEIVAGRKQIL